MGQKRKTRFIALMAITLIITIWAPNPSLAQRGYEAGTYYQKQYSVSEQPDGPVFPRYDYYGRFIGYFQVWRKARWYNDRGGEYIYIWTNLGWQSQWYEGTYWWYDWVTYERRVR